MRYWSGTNNNILTISQETLYTRIRSRTHVENDVKSKKRVRRLVNNMVSLTIGLLVLCFCGPLLSHIRAAPIQEEDDNSERSFKRELELFTSDIQDDWELDANEYLSRRELQDGYEQEKKMWDRDFNKYDGKSISNEDDKRWLDVDTPENGVSEEQQSPAFDDDLPKNGELFQEDIVMDDYVRDVFNGEAQKRDAVSIESYRWPNRTIYYVFDPNIDPNSKKTIQHAFGEYRKYTCIKIKKKYPGDTIKDYVRYISNGSACYSNVGRRGGRQDVSIGYGCLRYGTPIHETMHVLGFFHEMARPDRDKTVDIHWENIRETLKHNFRKIPESIDLKINEDMNLGSVMEYSQTAFSKNGLPTITAKNDPTKQFGQRCGFSVGDVREINILYNCPEYNERFESKDDSELLCGDL